MNTWHPRSQLPANTGHRAQGSQSPMTAVCGSKAAALEGHLAAARAPGQSGARALSTSARCPEARPLGGSPKLLQTSGLPSACLSTLLGAVDMLDQHRAPLIWGVERLRESWTGFFLALCFQEHSSSLGGNGCVPHSLYLVSSGFTVCPVDSQPCWPAWEGSQCG